MGRCLRPSNLKIRAARSANGNDFFCGVRRGNHAHIGEDTRYWKAFFDGDREQEVQNESRQFVHAVMAVSVSWTFV